MKVKVVKYEDLKTFLMACDLDDIRIVKMKNCGLVVPVKPNRDNLMDFKVCLTAISVQCPELKTCTLLGEFLDPKFVRDCIMMSGISVSDGKWEEKDAERVLGTKEKNDESSCGWIG